MFLLKILLGLILTFGGVLVSAILYFGITTIAQQMTRNKVNSYLSNEDIKREDEIWSIRYKSSRGMAILLFILFVIFIASIFIYKGIFL